MQIASSSAGREPDDRYFARRAAEHRIRLENSGDERARAAHRRFVAVYERFALRSFLDGSLG